MNPNDSQHPQASNKASPLQIMEVLERIMSFMTRSSVLRASLVSKHWNRAARYSLQKYHTVIFSSKWPWQEQHRIFDLCRKECVHRLKIDISKDKDLAPLWGRILAPSAALPHLQDPDNADPHSNQPEYLQELSFLGEAVPEASFYTILWAHSTSLRILDVQVTRPSEFNLHLTLETLPNLRDLRLIFQQETPPSSSDGITVSGQSTWICDCGCGQWLFNNSYDEEKTSWLENEGVFYPNLTSFELRQVRTVGSFLRLLLPKFPSLSRLKLMDCGSDTWRLWMDVIPKANPLVRDIGFSAHGSLLSHEFLSSLLVRFPKVESLELPVVGLNERTVRFMEQRCRFLTSLDLGSIPSSAPMDQAVYNILCGPTKLTRLTAPSVTFSVNDMCKDESHWHWDQLQVLVVRFNVLDHEAETHCKQTKKECSCFSAKADPSHVLSGILFNFLSRNCPRLMQLHAFVTPTICLGFEGLGNLAGLRELWDLDLLVEHLDHVDQRDVQWLKHENECEEDLYWPRLESMKIRSTAAYREVITDTLRHVENMELRFKFSMEVDPAGITVY